MDVWTIGAGGLLGSALVRRAQERERSYPAARIPWASPRDARETLERELDSFHRWRRPGPWAVVWAAGAGVIGSSAQALSSEQDVLLGFAAAVAARPHPGGTFVFASSASVYGDTGGQVADERSPTRPLSGYARIKLEQEAALTALLAGTVPLAVARISTLYGPGQNVGKGQGLVSTMCAEVISGRPITIFVPLDTQRDYLYSDDAAARCLHLAEESARGARVDAATVRVVASGRTTTIGEVARTVQTVAHRRAHLLQIQSPARSLHVRQQVLTTTDDRLRRMALLPLVEGVGRVHADLLRHQLVRSG